MPFKSKQVFRKYIFLPLGKIIRPVNFQAGSSSIFTPARRATLSRIRLTSGYFTRTNITHSRRIKNGDSLKSKTILPNDPADVFLFITYTRTYEYKL